MLDAEAYEKKRKGVPTVVIVLVVLTLLAGLCVGLVVFVMGLMKSSAAYQTGMHRVQNHPAAIAYLGEPIGSGHFVSGNINIEGPSGNAQIAIPVSGSKQTGTVYVQGAKSMGKWTFSDVIFRGASGEPEINLLEMQME